MVETPSIDWNAVVAVATIVGLFSTILAFRYEVRRNRTTRHVDLILSFNNTFHGPIMQKRRRRAAEFLRQSPSLPISDPTWVAVDDLIDFFQGLGTIVHYAEIDPALVFKYFYMWQSCYWQLCRGYVEAVRRTSKMTWQDADALYTALANYDRVHNGGALSAPTPKEIAAFLITEASPTD